MPRKTGKLNQKAHILIGKNIQNNSVTYFYEDFIAKLKSSFDFIGSHKHSSNYKVGHYKMVTLTKE